MSKERRTHDSIKAVDLVTLITDKLIHGFSLSEEDVKTAGELGIDIVYIQESLGVMYATEQQDEEELSFY